MLDKVLTKILSSLIGTTTLHWRKRLLISSFSVLRDLAIGELLMGPFSFHADGNILLLSYVAMDICIGCLLY